MSSKPISTEPKDEDSSCGILLREIEEISKALYLDKTLSKPFDSSHGPKLSISKSKPNVSVKIQDTKGKKSSLWDWKPLRALARIRNHRLNDNLGRFPRVSISTNDEIFPKQESELSESVTLLYSKLNEFSGGKNGDELSEPDFEVIEQGIEIPTNDQMKIESIDVAEIFESGDMDFDDYVEKNLRIIENREEKYAIDEEYALSFNGMLAPKPAEDSLPVKSNSTESLLISDDVFESIENDFLNMLTMDQIQDDYDLSFPVEPVEENHYTVGQSLRIRRNAKLLENLEEEALIHERGLTEKAFQYSPKYTSGGFGSPFLFMQRNL